jgi:hypothetical protein
MRRFKALRGAVVVACAVTGLLLMMASGAMAASPIYLCISSKAGDPVKSGGETGTCQTKYTKVALPSQQAEQQKLLSILPYIKYAASGVGGKPTIKFSGVNVQILSGSGSTAGPINGAGNLVIGYDDEPRAQTGSHNLILGERQSFTSYGGILAGFGNTISSPFSTVSGGYRNTASGQDASVSGGDGNTASGNRASVSGGSENTASSQDASVSGGIQNTAGGPFGYTSVSGGARNEASYSSSSVSGGEENHAGGPWSSISGGERNYAAGEGFEGYSPGPSSVSGGKDNHAEGPWSSISGGEDNVARTPVTSVSGGSHNVAGGVPPGFEGCCERGMGFHAASVSGGYKNTARAAYSAILGGKENLVESEFGHFP